MSDAFGEIIAANGLQVPVQIARFHENTKAKYRGRAQVQTGSWLARCITRLAGFPVAGQNVPFEIEVAPHAKGQIWRRQFASAVTTSVLSYDRRRGCAVERFGPFAIDLTLEVKADDLLVRVIGARIFGLPLPGWVTPRSAAREFATAQGQFGFDISASLPLVGLLIRYQGAFFIDT